MKINKQIRSIFLGVIAFLAISGCLDRYEENYSGEITQRHNPDMPDVMNMSKNVTNITKEADMKSEYQEIGLQIKADGYSPDVIIAKKGVPLRINITSDSNAGCPVKLVFPEFNINRTIPAGKTDVIEIFPDKEGVFNYRCTMDMYRGKLIVTN